MTSDDRMTWGLIGEVLDVLERHGYHQYDNRHTAQAIGAIADLASLYQGTRDASCPYQSAPAQHAGPVPPGPHDAVVLTDAEVSTIFAALQIAAGYNRDRAQTCADCPDQSCLTCQTRHRDARTYDQMAAQLLQTAEASRTASTYQPEPGLPPHPPPSPAPQPARRPASDRPPQKARRAAGRPPTSLTSSVEKTSSS
jgi:hypothetical protein